MTHNHRTITQWLARAPRRWPLLALLAGAVVLGPPASAAAATHETKTTSPDTLCGFTGTSYWVFDIGNGPRVGAGLAVRTFVANNGRGVKITYQAGVVAQIGPTVYYPDGSSSVTLVEDGPIFITQALGGPLLEQSTGRVTFTVYFDADGNFVSQTVDPTTGPENAGAPDCSVIGPYLAAG
jgi:hypothetical protein